MRSKEEIQRQIDILSKITKIGENPENMMSKKFCPHLASARNAIHILRWILDSEMRMEPREAVGYVSDDWAYCGVDAPLTDEEFLAMWIVERPDLSEEQIKAELAYYRKKQPLSHAH